MTLSASGASILWWVHVTATDWLISDALESLVGGSLKQFFCNWCCTIKWLSVSPVDCFFLFFFPHLAVRLSQSRSPGAMTVWHPIIPLSLIVLLHAPCASFNLSLKARCTANVLYRALFSCVKTQQAERRQKRISVFGCGQSIYEDFLSVQCFSCFTPSLNKHKVTLSLRLGSLSKVQVKSIWKHPQSQTTIHTHVQTNSWFRPLTGNACLSWIALTFANQTQK